MKQIVSNYSLDFVLISTILRPKIKMFISALTVCFYYGDNRQTSQKEETVDCCYLAVQKSDNILPQTTFYDVSFKDSIRNRYVNMNIQNKILSRIVGVSL